MTIQDLHVGDKILVNTLKPVPSDVYEYEVLDIRGEYAKFKALNDNAFWTNNISYWTLIEKLVDGKEKMARQEKAAAYKKELISASIPRRTRPDFLNLSDRSDCGGEED